jgi:hypothetical protein
MDPVVQRVKPKLRFLLGLLIEFLSQALTDAIKLKL